MPLEWLMFVISETTITGLDLAIAMSAILGSLFFWDGF